MRNLLKILFWKIIPQDSPISNFFRRLYHFFPDSALSVNRIIQRNNDSYPKWLKDHEEKIFSFGKTKNSNTKVSFFLNLDKNKNISSTEVYKSLISQTTENWELIVFLPEISQKRSIESNESNIDIRVKSNYSQNASINQFLRVSSGEYFVCCSPDDQFHKSFLTIFNQYFLMYPNSKIYFTDCEKIDFQNNRNTPFLKPEILAPELLLADNYLSRAIINKETALDLDFNEIEDIDLFLQEWHLLIDITKRTKQITHIPYILIKHHFYPVDSQNIKEKIFSPYFKDLNFEVNVDHLAIKYNWKFESPLVSIIIPTKNNTDVVKRTIESLITKTNYPNYEVLLIDNQSDNLDTLDYYKKIIKKSNIKIIPFQEKFNFSKANNLGAFHSKGELLLFLNNDMEIIKSDWLTELVQWALLPEIGVVGAKLLFPSGTIQHAGVIVGMQGIGGHIYKNSPDHFHGFLGSVDWYHNFSAVTGACQMIRKQLFTELNGFDENYQLAFSDVDLCYKAIDNGYRILYNPFSILIHHQGKSRGYFTPDEDVSLAKRNLAALLEKGDPYYSKNLELTPIPGMKFESK